MTEHIADKQIEQLFKLGDEIVRAPSRFTKDFVVENLALGVADLCGVIDRLRAQLAEIGETREEFGVHWADQPEPSVYEDEAEARREVTGANRSDDVPNAVLKARRAPGEWREVEK